ncbi:ShlB/FhaC/HecB family hemolysin secretion/activation protein [Variovorax paradoxus]|uniref:ShlB/FhaC/HecB family hemolysin secretion/activation protein n=1 Tax=Variovorax paradoxus TaxID=34073 RepID=A0A6I6HQP5_VARPD|nr:ShlB/FhaC/HecB family hemolysin secretion/activation protein [Variovorax paradoxus]QGW84912.1 ShlB/FhaC/HecB family hemolysin secretion/activation protein [Variovorax paradoxus]
MALAVALTASPLWAVAQQTPTTPQSFVEQQRQQERERALREQNERTVDQRLQAAPPAPVARIPASEAPCFRIDRVLLVGEQAELFQWAVSDLSGPDGNDSPLGHCLGTAGVNVVLARAQQAAIARGFVTTRVLAAPQDLSTGTLTLSLVPGRIAAIRLTPDSSSTLLGSGALLGSAIPARPGALLNLRDIEQGLENLKRAPTAEADIQIEPSTAPNARPGDSDLVVKYVQAKKWRVALSLDDSGTKATGRYQAGATVSVDNPFGLNDLFYLSANHSINSHFLSEPSYGTEGQTVHYSLPYGYWMLGFTASNSQYHQSVAGLNQDYVYAGKTNNAEVKLSRLLYRDQSRKTTLALKGFRRESRNFVDDTEVDVQHRVVGGWELGLNHKEFIGEATLEGTLALKHGTGGFGARTSPQEIYHRNHPDEPLEGTSRMKLYTAEVSLNAPFKLGAQKLRYSGLIRAQWNRTPLMPQDRFAIGGRYTVRGFDGETSLMGERGWLIRNDIGWAIPTGSGQSGAELYVGADYGHVGGRSTVDGLGRSLAGAVIGVRGQWSKLSYDFFMGAPIRKPEGYRTARTTFGFNLNASF